MTTISLLSSLMMGATCLTRVVFALPFAIEQKIIPAHFTSACRRLSGPFPNSLFHFRAGRASLQRLFLRVFGKANPFHDPDKRLQFQPYRFFTSSWLRRGLPASFAR